MVNVRTRPYARPMTTPAELRDAVARAYDRLDAPAWEDPHTDGRASLEEEYERVTDPARYGIIPLRARLWREALVVAGATATPVEVDPEVQAEPYGPGTVDRALRLDPPPATQGALPILLLETDVPSGGGILPVVRFALGTPADMWASHPDCGCDACDDGSANLLEAIDDSMARLLGPTVSLRGRTSPLGPVLQGRTSPPGQSAPTPWGFHWAQDSAGGWGELPGGFEALHEACTALLRGEAPPLPEDTAVVVGRPWFD